MRSEIKKLARIEDGQYPFLSLNLVSSIGDSSIPCNLCKGETKTVDLGEEMMRSTLRQDGEVKWIEENSILKENDGVGASLRFSSSR